VDQTLDQVGFGQTYALGSDPKSAVSGKFDVTVLPKGGDNGKNAACLGGWQLMINE
jgi:trehalose/maltose transport system substrate-binding protein